MTCRLAQALLKWVHSVVLCTVRRGSLEKVKYLDAVHLRGIGSSGNLSYNQSRFGWTKDILTLWREILPRWLHQLILKSEQQLVKLLFLSCIFLRESLSIRFI